MTNQDTERLVTLIRAQFGLPDLIAQLARLLFTTGQPVTIDQAAAAGGWTADQVRAELSRHPGVDWIMLRCGWGDHRSDSWRRAVMICSESASAGSLWSAPATGTLRTRCGVAAATASLCSGRTSRSARP
jgi:hypothetical protein